MRLCFLCIHKLIRYMCAESRVICSADVTKNKIICFQICTAASMAGVISVVSDVLTVQFGYVKDHVMVLFRFLDVSAVSH